MEYFVVLFNLHFLFFLNCTVIVCGRVFAIFREDKDIILNVLLFVSFLAISFDVTRTSVSCNKFTELVRVVNLHFK